MLCSLKFSFWRNIICILKLRVSKMRCLKRKKRMKTVYLKYNHKVNPCLSPLMTQVFSQIESSPLNIMIKDLMKDTLVVERSICEDVPMKSKSHTLALLVNVASSMVLRDLLIFTCDSNMAQEVRLREKKQRNS